MNRSKLLLLIEVAIFAGIGLVLDMLSINLWFQGGSISLVMVPIVLMSIRWGLVGGLSTGLIIGILQILAGRAYILYPAQGFLDYFIAFTVVGLAALVRHKVLQARNEQRKGKMITYIVLGAVFGGLFRLITHVIAGVIFFSEAAEGKNVWIYSLVYNGGYMIPSIILTAIVCSIIFVAAPRLIEHRNNV
ncbi:energy-coupled thiamine transporter ThiT [Paenisporosarcina quisquiliarum]|uniref:Energy-coupled thiamine transporter ThiT n=1 Tax=Paenisporosarcina quisquiliarum TaxID=365346 RepID=A0A9X3LFM3_9BACL|nr:energy-coupled thiamine transporter ThiT [Paenisporosarcina quisquiliarum]MCZ8537013.1 energy-coupled thiamine transporter ThiT [Paenisporosarcina quisquiliarum]